MKVIVLARPGSSTAILLNWLLREGHSDLELILEAAPKRLQQIRQRARRLGWSHALGQVLFMGVAMPVLRRQSAARRHELLRAHDLDDRMPSIDRQFAVETINDRSVVDRLRGTRPDIVLVNGTRIIRGELLNATEAPVINTHVGITPDYRGVHGGYWALWNNEPDKFGVTLHMVDEGVDTGNILAQVTARPTSDDNLASYALLQQLAAFGKLKQLLEAIERGDPLSPLQATEQGGKQWTHPTLLEYALGRVRGVR